MIAGAERNFASAEASALHDAIHAAVGADALDQFARTIWHGFGAGAVSEDDAATLQALIDRRRPLAIGRGGVGARALGKFASRFAPRQSRRLTDQQKQAARERRRSLASSSPMPWGLCNKFSESLRAVLAIIGGEVKYSGNCDLAIDHIGALAGVCRSSVQAAIHEARRLGLIRVTERPQPGRKNLTNVITVISKEWLAWIKRGPAAHRPARIGSKISAVKKNLRRAANFLSPTNNIFEKKNGEKEVWRGSGPPDTRTRRE